MAKMKDILKQGMVFKSKDKTGDFANELMFVGKNPEMSDRWNMSGERKKFYVYVIFSDGGSDWFTLKELNIDPKSVKKYDPDCQIDFYGMHG